MYPFLSGIIKLRLLLLSLVSSKEMEQNMARQFTSLTALRMFSLFTATRRGQFRHIQATGSNRLGLGRMISIIVALHRHI